MSSDWIRGLLAGLWEKLKIVFERCLDAPAIIRAWSEGRASAGDRAALIVGVVIVVAVVAWVVSFFKAGFWKKLGLLLSAALIVFAAAIALSFFSSAEDTPLPELPLESILPLKPQTSAAPAEDGTASAPAETAQPRRSNEKYSLARGAEDPVNGRVNEMWRIVDDKLSWQLSDDLIVQLSGLHSLPGTGRFAVEEMVNYGDRAEIVLRSFEGSGDESSGRRSECVLEIVVWPGAKLTRMPWYAEEPRYVATGEGEGYGYNIFSSTASEVQFWEKKADVTNARGDAVMALCLGKQVGSDVVLVKARAFTTVTEAGHTEYTDYSPDPEEELRRRLEELERAVFDGRVRLLRGLSQDSVVSILPGELVDYAVGKGSGRGGFTLPCSRLLEMRRSEALGSVIRLIGPGPKGEEMLYSLVDGAALYENVRTDRYFVWREGYENGWLEPDEAMTAFLGCPAVACDGGWVIDAGSFYSAAAGQEMENYYFLGVEVRTPAPTPEPTPTPAPAQEGETNDG